ncbi:hypothetical protein H4R18_002775 [Coemansia javaensis]|uniref:Aminoglycoside phosphotransferase domain-containing protein n=1 Tax=Coemansia javaensis TaxID=2761396 RepID=A0A9W8LI88_9FUNG|nr:hypothetical protein H4R18_002775 [Coemansia javaensis]
MASPARRPPAHRRLGAKGSAPALSADNDYYFDALTSVDRSIRSLNSARTARLRGLAIDVDVPPAACGLSSPPGTAPLPPRAQSAHSRRGRRGTRGFSQLPPSLDFASAGTGGGDDDDCGDDEEAVVAFLCSGLPHYEGSAPIIYDDLDQSLHIYQMRAADCNEPDDDEEYVSDSAWAAPAQQTHSRSLPSPLTPSLPGAPQTAAAAAAAAAAGDTHEGWIDLDELLAAACSAADPGAGFRFRIGARTETDHMLLYAIETVPAGGPACVAQIPKRSVPPGAFESEILSLAYVNEHTELPVPPVLSYSFSAANSVGVPYAILDRVPGEPLAAHWPRLPARRKRRVLDQIAAAVVQLTRLQFPAIGSLTIGDGCLELGPLLHARQCEDGYAALPPSPGRYGPFASTREYYRAMVQASLDVVALLEQEYDTGSRLSYGNNNNRHAGPSLDQMELQAHMEHIDRILRTGQAATAAAAAAAADSGRGGGERGPFALMPESMDLHHFRIDPATCQVTGIVDWTFCGTRPLATVVQPPAFLFDDTPRWEPTRRDARLAHRRNLVRHRQWYKAALQKKAWAVLGKAAADELADMVRFGYWRFKLEAEICEHIRYTNPWAFRAIWEHLRPDQDFAVWFAAVQAGGHHHF